MNARLQDLPEVVVAMRYGPSSPAVPIARDVVDGWAPARDAVDTVSSTLQRWNERFGWTPRDDGSKGIRILFDSTSEHVAGYRGASSATDGWHEISLGGTVNWDPAFASRVHATYADARYLTHPQVITHEMGHYLTRTEELTPGSYRDAEHFRQQFGPRSGDEAVADLLTIGQTGDPAIARGAFSPASGVRATRDYAAPRADDVFHTLLTTVAERTGHPGARDPHVGAGVIGVPVIAATRRAGMQPAHLEELVFRTVTDGGLSSLRMPVLAEALAAQAGRMGDRFPHARRHLEDAFVGAGVLRRTS